MPEWLREGYTANLCVSRKSGSCPRLKCNSYKWWRAPSQQRLIMSRRFLHSSLIKSHADFIFFYFNVKHNSYIFFFPFSYLSRNLWKCTFVHSLFIYQGKFRLFIVTHLIKCAKHNHSYTFEYSYSYQPCSWKINAPILSLLHKCQINSKIL